MGGYFLEDDIRLFENSSFGINNREATCMDPQRRKLLEIVYECFASAGLSLEAVSGADIGCYGGNFTAEFMTIPFKDPELATADGQIVMTTSQGWVRPNTDDLAVQATTIASDGKPMTTAVKEYAQFVDITTTIDGKPAVAMNLVTTPKILSILDSIRIKHWHTAVRKGSGELVA